MVKNTRQYLKKWHKKHPGYDTKLYHEYKCQLWSLKCNPCTDCKQWFNPWQMEFDHLPSFKKKFQINCRLGLSKRVINEIRKCQLVCANCHNNRTYRTRIYKQH